MRSGDLQKVLLVEDDPQVRYTMEVLAAQWATEVMACTNIRDAQARIKTEKFDLLVSDVRLPDGLGTELAVMAARQEPQMAILLVTGYAEEEKLDRARALGIDVLPKPFRAREFENAVDRTLREHRANEADGGDQQGVGASEP